MAWRGIIEQYRSFLPVTASTPIVTLGEGNTPLVRAPRLAEAIAPNIELYLKFEGANPTGSWSSSAAKPAASRPPAAPPAVPEPSTLALLALGGVALAGWRRWKGKRLHGNPAV